MVSSDLGACEWFVWDLRRSGLIDRGHLDQVVGEFLKRNPRAEPPALAEYLVKQTILSPFQAERILQGKTQGLVLGPYILMDSIGQGSMGQVYKASSKTDSQLYAVKVLPRRSMWNVRLARRQVRSFSQFSHSSVVPFVDVGTAGGQHYLVWPLAEGEVLEKRVEREGKLSPEVASQIIAQVAQGLAQSHHYGLFHGLIKPSNILLGTDGQAKILDFGIGSLLVENEGESLVDTMSTANTLTSGLDCASPESIMEPTNRTQAGDQYSLGCVLYYCLSGRYPFPEGTAVEKMMAHQFKQPTPIRELVSNLPEGLVVVVERLMQKSPEGRFASAEEIVEALMPYTQPRSHMKAAGQGPRQPLPGQNARPQAAPAQPTYAPPPQPTYAPPPQPTYAPPPAYNPPAPPVTRNTFSAPAPAPAPVMPPNYPQPSPFGIDPGALPSTPVPHNTPSAPMPVSRPQPSGQVTPGWVEPPRTPVVGPLLIMLVAALVTALVYLLGKNFLFPNT